MARNEEKIKEKLKLIKEHSKKDIKTMCVVADLGKMSTIKEYEGLAHKLHHIDIGILVLNAGMSMMSPFIDLTPEEVE